DHTIVGDHARVRAQVKVWPDKQIESGAVIGSSLIWGAQGRRALFGRFGVTGIVNIDLTPEFVARLGAAYASTLKQGATITMNRDQHRSSRMLKRGLMSGIVSAGVHVADLSQAPLPIGRFHTRRLGAAGRVHGRVSPLHGTPAQFLPQLLNVLGVEAVAVNGVVSENIGSRSFEEFQEEQRQLAVLVPALGASLGVIIDAGGEKIFVVDDRGRVINDMLFLTAFVSLTVRQAPGAVAVPVYAPSSIEQIVLA